MPILLLFKKGERNIQGVKVDDMAYLLLSVLMVCEDPMVFLEGLDDCQREGLLLQD